ncbi:MAG: S4 domain-containing protein [Rhabdaerophilum sp.]
MRRGGAEKPVRSAAEAAVARQRLDLWLWHARFLRSRKDCAALVQAGYVRLDAMRVVQPGHAIKIGDVLTLALPTRTLLVTVTAFSERRRDAGAARKLYKPVEMAP